MRERRIYYLFTVGVLLIILRLSSSAPTLPNATLDPQLAIAHKPTVQTASPSTTSANNANSTTVSTLLIHGKNGEQIVIKIVNQPSIKVEVPTTNPSQYSSPSTTLMPTTTTTEAVSVTTTTEPPTTTTLPQNPLTWTSWSYGPYYEQSGQGTPPTIFMPLGTLKVFASVTGLPKGTISFAVIGGSAQTTNANGPDYYGSNDCSAVHDWSGQASGGCAITFNQSGTYVVRANYLGQNLNATVNVS